MTEIEKCSFCGREISSCDRLIKSPINKDIYICNTCADIVETVFYDSINKKSGADLRRCLTEHMGIDMDMEITEPKTKTAKKNFLPSEIHRELDRFIIGQERAKKVLSVAIYNHSKRLNDKTGLIKKSNILLIGPSGSGKTLLAKTLAKIIDVPFAMADATSLTEAGYVGDDVETCLQKLIHAADGNINLAQKGIIYIDEIDKIARKGTNRSITRDVSGEGVQASLLKLIEGSLVSVPVTDRRKQPQGNNVDFDTTNVLFICGGAFEGISDKSAQKCPIGFGSLSTDNEKSENIKESSVQPENLIKFGMMPELIGRLPVVCTLNDLKEDDLIRVLTEPEDAITKEYQLLFKKDGIPLTFEKDALKKIAKIAISQKTGARGLRSILEDVMLDVMYNIPDQKDKISKCIITADSIITKEPLIVEKKQRKKAVTAP